MSLWMLPFVNRYNEAAQRADPERRCDCVWCTREGVDVDLWRALPDSPNA